ncbi:MAG: glutathione S-transferase family protein [Kiloniellales bacterium]|nr:glutathione S-transferase family protein [Kiloniellales bacterium]
MKLMYGPLSPFARKVRIVAMELDLADRIELVLTEVAPGKPNAAYARDCYPLRKVPAMTLDDGTALYDSGVICEYLNDLAGGERLLPASGPKRWQRLAQHALANGMCDGAVLLRYETWLRPEELRWQMWIDDQWDKIFNGLDWFEAHADELAQPINLPQIALGCLLGYLDFRFEATDWRSRCPKLEAWFAEIAKRESFAETKPSAA